MARLRQVVSYGRGARVKGTCVCTGLDPRDRQSDPFV